MYNMNYNNTDLSPTGNDLEAQDYQLDESVWTLENIRRMALHQRLPRPRSLAWGIMLKTLPPPNHDLEESLRTHRSFYNDLKKKLSMDPRTVLGDDPLSQNDESAWNQHFCDNELKALILQDVVRTFPDELYFRGQEVQDLMVRVLFFWSRSHSHVGYRQGMHEILAPMLFELFCDRKYASSNLSGLLKVYLDEDCLEHDSYMLFSALMKGLERFYTTGDIIPTSCGRMPSSKVVHNPNEVVRYLERIKEEHLVPLDPELAEHLNNCNISLELFGIRWLRLLFGREFPRSEIAHLWGYLFSDGPTLPSIHFVVIAILISMRHTLLHPESGMVLSALMRPCGLSVGHVVCLALHLSQPLLFPRPPTPPPTNHVDETNNHETLPPSLEESWVADDGSVSSEGVPEGGDVGTELATLAVLRAELPRAVAALAAALPVQHRAHKPLHRILQLTALLQCRNHAIIDVETALEAAEAQTTDNRVGRRQLVPIAILGGKRGAQKPVQPPTMPRIKEVQLKTFHQAECKISDSEFPCLDPLGQRTE